MQIESNRGSTSEFDEFVAAGEVEVGEDNAGVKEGEEEKKPAPKRGPPKVKETKEAPKPAVADEADDDDEGEDQGGDEEEGGEEEEGAKPQKTAKDHQIERLKREKRQLQRELREGGVNAAISQRLENIESRLTGGNGDGTKTTGKPAPDPSDADKYPLGHLDDRYIEDKLEWLADRKATEQADSVLQRQREEEQNRAAAALQTELLEKVDDLSAKGSELYENFQEDVVETGMRGEWDLGQPTFEAAAEADHGAQILFELSQDKKEARRVARLSPYQQLKFVQERDAEIGSGKKARTKPQAGEPAKNQARGANSSTKINPATDNLNDFEKAWKADAKKSQSG